MSKIQMKRQSRRFGILGAAVGRQSKKSSSLQRRVPPLFEGLEERLVFSTFVVNTPAGLAPAIASANTTLGHDTIELQFTSPAAIPLTTAQGTINPSFPDVAGSGLTIVNQGAQVAILGTGPGSIFTISSNSGAVQISGQSAPIVLENGITTGNGGAINDLSTAALSISNAIFTGNKAANGGAIYATKNAGPLTVSNSKFGPGPGSQVPKLPATPGNVASGVGGAIDYVGASTLTISNSTFVSNMANGASGGAIFYSGAGGLSIGANSVFLSNRANSTTPKLVAAGGAIAIGTLNTKNPQGAVIDNTSFHNNSANGSVGTTAINIGGGASGGAIYNAGGALTLTNSQFVGNTANAGAGSTSSTGVGGAGGNAAGGAIDHVPALATSALNISNNSAFLSNLAIAGTGGSGLQNSASPGGAGASGGAAWGGAVADYGSGPDIVVASFYSNGAKAGSGGAGAGFGAGGSGGNATGGALASRSLSASVSNSSFGSNSVKGGNGGAGGAGGTGTTSGLPGAGGAAFGGAVENEGSMTTSGTTFTNNSGAGGAGGLGTSPQPGGAGGSATGGAVFNNKASISIAQDGFFGNIVTGGAGGAIVGTASPNGGAAGAGGTAAGGALATTLNASASSTSFQSNNAIGGAGGPSRAVTAAGLLGGNGGNGGSASGGAIDDEAFANSGSFIGSILTITSNLSTAGAGGTGGTGGTGGGALGGGMNASDLLSQVSYSNFSLNIATGGAGGAGTTPGYAGQSEGGGVRNNHTLTLTGDSFVANTAAGGSGATAPNGNSAGLGGAVYSDSGILTTAGYQPASLTMISDTLSENSATGPGSAGGGGLYNNDSTATVTECTFRENTAIGTLGSNGFGGGIYDGAQAGTLILSFSTLTFNSATTAYGGLYGGGPVTLSFDNITFNNAPTNPDM